MRSVFVTLAIASALGFAAAPAAAQNSRQSRPYAAPAYGATPYGYACRPMCPMDVTPCDPPHYKIADGRCAATSPSLPF